MSVPNKVVHFEIPIDNPTRAQAFYEKTFGWKIAQFPGFEYWSVGTTPVNDKREPTEAGINGGFSKRSPVVGHPVVTIDVASIEKSLATVERHGGKTVQGKQPVGDMGFTAYFRDTEGNVVGLWQNAR